MKFEVKQLKAESHSRGYIAQEYVNSPLGVSLAVGTALQLLPGVNLTDEGEFIPAPGFAELESPTTDTVTISREAARSLMATAVERIRDDPAAACLNFPLRDAIEELERVTKVKS